MKIHTTFDSFIHVRNPVVTIGTFDGVHLGHAHILSKLIELAKKINGETVLLTFYPHPRMILHPEDHGLQLLSSQDEKATLLEMAGIDHLVVLPFTKEFSRIPAFEYVRDLLVSGLRTHTLVIGYDHRFGKNREGNHATLLELSETFGYLVHEIPARQIDEAAISSTKIRGALQLGDIKLANKLLGYPYQIAGKVVPGDGRGRTIGYPTANVLPHFEFKLVPFQGVYAAWITCEGRDWPALVNIGTRPTFSLEKTITIEAHLLAFQGDLYNKTIGIRFIDRLRNEQKFGSIVELVEQIKSDIQIAQRHFNE